MTSSRRTILTGLAALPLASVPALASTPDPVFAAIEKHRVANQAYLLAMGKTTSHVHVPEDLQQARDVASDAEEEARYDMHEAVPTTFAGLKAYVAYWQAYIGIDDFMTESFGWEAVATIAEALEGIAHV